jgi:hypothetical protein
MRFRLLYPRRSDVCCKIRCVISGARTAHVASDGIASKTLNPESGGKQLSILTVPPLRSASLSRISASRPMTAMATRSLRE